MSIQLNLNITKYSTHTNVILGKPNQTQKFITTKINGKFLQHPPL